MRFHRLLPEKLLIDVHNRDMAKYLVFDLLQKFVHFPHETQSAPTTTTLILRHGREKTKSRPLGNRTSSLAPDPYQPTHLHLLVTVGRGPIT